MCEVSSSLDSYIVAGTKSWNRRVYQETICRFDGKWIYLDDREQLTLKLLDQINPRFIFFLHWSWKVSEQIINDYECVCFHMTDVPYGRGGTPLQNLVVNGHRETMLTALRMVSELDAGPVYLKKSLSLEGNAEQIYVQASELSAQMIKTIIDKGLTPTPQSGQVSYFTRRRPSESEIPHLNSLQELHDFLRMLDAEGYPKAFLKNEGFRYEFSRAVNYEGRIVADVTITAENGSDE